MKPILLLLTCVSFSLSIQAQWGNCGPMSYNTQLCAGSSTSITGTPISGASYYQWVLFNNVSGTALSSYTTNSPSNSLTTSSTQIQNVLWDVWAFNSGGVKIGYCAGAVAISSGVPSTPTDISWSGNLCIEQAKTYTSSDVGAASYLWEVVEVSYSQTTSSNSIYLSGSIFNQSGYYTLRVRGSNSCGASDWHEETIQVISGCSPY